MSSLFMIWLLFALCAATIGVAGAKLSRYGDIIADKTGLSGSWIGLILLATVTSLPELFSGISAVTLAHVPNIAVGDVMGSCVFNLMILTVLDFCSSGESVYRRASQGHLLSAGFGIVLIGFSGLNILLAGQSVSLAIGHIGLYSPAIVLLYFVAIRAVFFYEKQQVQLAMEQVSDRYPQISLRQAALGYATCALFVVIAGIALPFIGSALADAMGWHKTFVRTLFIAAATSLPELAVTFGALRIGALDMAIANLLGSNLFNIFILAIDDAFYLTGPLLAHVSASHALSALSAIMMTGVVIVGLVYRPNKRLFRALEWISLGLFSLYALNTTVLYLYGGE